MRTGMKGCVCHRSRHRSSAGGTSFWQTRIKSMLCLPRASIIIMKTSCLGFSLRILILFASDELSKGFLSHPVESKASSCKSLLLRMAGDNAELSLDPSETAFVFIEYQNEFTTPGGKLHDAVKPVMDATNSKYLFVMVFFRSIFLSSNFSFRQCYKIRLDWRNLLVKPAVRLSIVRSTLNLVIMKLPRSPTGF